MAMGQYLEEDTIFTFPAMLQQTPNHTQTLDTTTARHLATAMDPPSHNHWWREANTFDLTKLKSSMKLPEEIAKLEDLVLHALFRTTKPCRFVNQ